MVHIHPHPLLPCEILTDRQINKKNHTKTNYPIPELTSVVLSYSFLQPNKVIEDSSKSRNEQISLAGKPATIRGISIGTARALLRARVPHLAMLVEVLTDLGEVSQITTLPKLVQKLEGILTKEQIRKACNEASGRPSHRNAKKNAKKQKDREKILAFQDFLVKLSIDNINHKNMDKMTKKSPGGRGRPNSSVYIPSEKELKVILMESMIISENGSSRRNPRLEGEFSIFPVKPLEVFNKSCAYKDFVMCYQIFQSGKDDYSRNELTAPIGDNSRNAKRRAQKTGIEITPNAPKLKLLKQHDEKDLLPRDEATRLLWINKFRCTESHHLRTDKIDSKRYPFTWRGAQNARKASETGKIYIAVDQKSTYDPSGSKYYASLKKSGERSLRTKA